MDLPIILIGPMAAGKTTLANLLAKKLGLPHYELDERRWDYYAEIGYDKALAAQIRSEEGFFGLYRYWKPFEIHAVERLGGLHRRGDQLLARAFGFVRMRRCSSTPRPGPCANVILLLPSTDPDEAAAILKERFIEQGKQEGSEPSPQTLEMVEHFIKHPSNQRLAKWVVYTYGKSAEQTCDEIIQRLRNSP
jgi:hypothetical protein